MLMKHPGVPDAVLASRSFPNTRAEAGCLAEAVERFRHGQAG